LLRQRNEQAIAAAAEKYSKYCYTVSYSILHCNEDADECVNDTFLRAWNAIPPSSPDNLAVFLGTITRNLSLNLYKKKKAEKRGFGQIQTVLDELAEVVPDTGASFDDYEDSAAITAVINGFLKSLPEKQRNVFVRRYWHLRGIEEIAEDYGLTSGNVKQILFRARKNLKKQFEKEGISL